MVVMLVQVPIQKTPCPSQKIITAIKRVLRVGTEIKEGSRLDPPVINLQELLQCPKDPNGSQRNGHLTDLVPFIGYVEFCTVIRYSKGACSFTGTRAYIYFVYYFIPILGYRDQINLHGRGRSI